MKTPPFLRTLARVVLRPLVRHVEREVEKRVRDRAVSAARDAWERQREHPTMPPVRIEVQPQATRPPDFTDRVMQAVRDGEARERRSA